MLDDEKMNKNIAVGREVDYKQTTTPLRSLQDEMRRKKLLSFISFRKFIKY